MSRVNADDALIGAARAVMEALGCEQEHRPTVTKCARLGHSTHPWTDQGCPVAVDAARAAYAGLGLTEEVRYVDPIQPHPRPTPLERRLVSKWVEVRP